MTNDFLKEKISLSNNNSEDGDSKSNKFKRQNSTKMVFENYIKKIQDSLFKKPSLDSSNEPKCFSYLNLSEKLEKPKGISKSKFQTELKVKKKKNSNNLIKSYYNNFKNESIFLDKSNYIKPENTKLSEIQNMEFKKNFKKNHYEENNDNESIFAKHPLKNKINNQYSLNLKNKYPQNYLLMGVLDPNKSDHVNISNIQKNKNYQSKLNSVKERYKNSIDYKNITNNTDNEVNIRGEDYSELMCHSEIQLKIDENLNDNNDFYEKCDITLKNKKTDSNKEFKNIPSYTNFQNDKSSFNLEKFKSTITPKFLSINISLY